MDRIKKEQYFFLILSILSIPVNSLPAVLAFIEEG
jgi:hypothetical protein